MSEMKPGQKGWGMMGHQKDWDDLIDRADHARDERKNQIIISDDDDVEPDNGEWTCRHGFPLDAWCDKCELGIY